MHKSFAVNAPRTLCLLCLLALSACAGISPFNQQAYENATAAKAEALLLIARATEPFAEHRPAVEALKVRISFGYEYANGLPKNRHTTEQWAILIDPQKNLLGGFLKRWEEQSQLSPAFVENASQLIAEAFDAIIGLESGKIKPKDLK